MSESTHPDTIVIGMNGMLRLYVVAPPNDDIRIIPAEQFDRLAAVVRALVAYEMSDFSGRHVRAELWSNRQRTLHALTPDDIEAIQP